VTTTTTPPAAIASVVSETTTSTASTSTTTTTTSTTTTSMSTTTTSLPCHPSYGACVPTVASDVDCGGSGDGPVFIAAMSFPVVGADVYELDFDGDGIACEAVEGPVLVGRSPTRGRPVEELGRTSSTVQRPVPKAPPTVRRLGQTGVPIDRHMAVAAAFVLVGWALLEAGNTRWRRRRQQP
jgi:hypothetical protein